MDKKVIITNTELDNEDIIANKVLDNEDIIANKVLDNEDIIANKVLDNEDIIANKVLDNEDIIVNKELDNEDINLINTKTIISDWTIVDDKMKNLKHPLVFLINILKYQRKVDDYLLSILLRFYIKNNFELCFNLPIFLIFNHIDSRFEITKKVINDFYTSLSKKIYFLKSIIEFKKSCEGLVWFDRIFNNTIFNQRIKIDEICCFFKSHFDASKTGTEGIMRLIGNLKSSFSKYEYDKNPIIFEIKDRFHRLDSFFGRKIFEDKKIIIITEEEFDKISNEDKIKYILYFYLKTEKFFNKILYTYDVLMFEDNKLKQILNPKPIIINLESEQTDRSDTDELDI
jgi:hypothetical protein